MSSPLAEDYLYWLAPQIRDEQCNPGRQYTGLVLLMHEKKFHWPDTVPHDDNRAGDGKDLRIDFCRSQHIPTDSLRDLGEASFLEVLIALSRRLQFQAGGTAPRWAWTLICNLELDKMSDPVGPSKSRKIDNVLETCMDRTYSEYGQGGFFPLAWPDEDQRQVEIWYQMSAYIREMPDDDDDV